MTAEFVTTIIKDVHTLSVVEPYATRATSKLQLLQATALLGCPRSAFAELDNRFSLVSSAVHTTLDPILLFVCMR